VTSSTSHSLVNCEPNNKLSAISETKNVTRITVKPLTNTHLNARWNSTVDELASDRGVLLFT
jgi:hypothetical protein